MHTDVLVQQWPWSAITVVNTDVAIQECTWVCWSCKAHVLIMVHACTSSALHINILVQQCTWYTSTTVQTHLSEHQHAWVYYYLWCWTQCIEYTPRNVSCVSWTCFFFFRIHTFVCCPLSLASYTILFHCPILLAKYFLTENLSLNPNFWSFVVLVHCIWFWLLPWAWFGLFIGSGRVTRVYSIEEYYLLQYLIVVLCLVEFS